MTAWTIFERWRLVLAVCAYPPLFVGSISRTSVPAFAGGRRLVARARFRWIISSKAASTGGAIFLAVEAAGFGGLRFRLSAGGSAELITTTGRSEATNPPPAPVDLLVLSVSIILFNVERQRAIQRDKNVHQCQSLNEPRDTACGRTAGDPTETGTFVRSARDA